MSEKMTRATPAGIPRSRSLWTRRQRAKIKADLLKVKAEAEAYREMYGDYDDWDDDHGDPDRCDRCGGEGVIEYAEAGPEVWGEDCPSEVNHLVTCPECGGGA